ncbi:translational activator of GCN4, partial [Elasticomyces elasticus]
VQGLDEFLARFGTQEIVNKKVIPVIEKAILRAPDNVLQGPIVALAQAMPQSVDLGPALSSKLLKPLTAAFSSTNVANREGAARSLSALLARKQNQAELEKTIKELTAQVKASKAAGFEARGLICDCIATIQPSQTSSSTIVAQLLQVASKESNESALRRELAAVTAHASFALDNGLWTKEHSDIVVKGCNEKRTPFKKVWLLYTASALLKLDALPSSAVAKDFVGAALAVMADTYAELSASPLPAAQAGTIAMAYAIPAMLQHEFLAGMVTDTKLKSTSQFLSNKLGESTSFLVNSKVYTKLSTAYDQQWALRALIGVDSSLQQAEDAGKTAWGRALLHLLLAPETDAETRRITGEELAQRYVAEASGVGSSVVLGIWDYLRDESAAPPRKLKEDEVRQPIQLRRVVSAISPGKAAWKQKFDLERPQAVLEQQAISTAVLYGPELVPGVEWVENLLDTGVDPGQLTTSYTNELMQEILRTFEAEKYTSLSIFERAACRAAATLTFVAPDAFVPVLVKQIKDDLNPNQLEGLDAIDATIAKAPEGVIVVDPLVKTDRTVENKNVKDYDTLKWEAELKAQLDKKKGPGQKKLTPDQQAKVDAQMKHEKDIRQRVK